MPPNFTPVTNNNNVVEKHVVHSAEDKPAKNMITPCISQTISPLFTVDRSNPKEYNPRVKLKETTSNNVPFQLLIL
jgi:hypothetical protein